VLHVKRHERTELGEKWPVCLACDSDFHVNRWVLLHAANLRHVTDGFTSPPKERHAVDFFRPKNPTASAGGFFRLKRSLLSFHNYTYCPWTLFKYPYAFFPHYMKTIIFFIFIQNFTTHLGTNPWSLIPEASMLTTRPPKPLAAHRTYCTKYKRPTLHIKTSISEYPFDCRPSGLTIVSHVNVTASNLHHPSASVNCSLPSPRLILTHHVYYCIMCVALNYVAVLAYGAFGSSNFV
jgi:hypothetical protein